ncbi:MAG: PRC-barrel domain-containing protein [bacterium]|nr:PRC-barrel domain-containing protein [bacterium]
MLMAGRQLLKLPVFTKSGIRIGRIVDFSFEAESQTVIQYEVRAFFGFGTPFVIHRNQVVALQSDRMVVEDAIAPERMRRVLNRRQPKSAEQPAPLSSDLGE